ncbi:MAG: deoxyguanosinetriphosphate triphosphohydrolase [Ruminococcaceae bacterium]|nr:deoxyguanosinetriphosphate triphosphohydrolase [Oscillospiraceae bacterium]
MNIRQEREMLERQLLAPYAFFSEHSRGRQREEEPCDIRTAFARDRDRIIHSKAFRRLKHKTQVFISLDNDHYRTRLTHTLEVAQIARTIARAVRLNEDLTEAISMGHDLGHTPFGHAGEKILDELSPHGFHHYEQSLRVVDVLENDGRGLNLTHEVRNGIVNHTGKALADTMEGIVVKYADRFAYINHDIDDALRAGILTEEDIPYEFKEILGDSHSGRIDTLIRDLVGETRIRGEVTMTAKVEETMLALRQFMFEHVYGALATRDGQAEMVIERLYRYFISHTEKLPAEYKALLKDWDAQTVVCDYIAGMTDYYSIHLFEDLFMPIH